MAADHHESRKRINKQHRPRISCFSLKSCFGSFDEKRESNDDKFVNHRTRRASGRASTRTVPISQPVTSSLVGSGTEIHEIEAVQTSVSQKIVAPQSHELIKNNKVIDMCKKNKNASNGSQLMSSTKLGQNSTNEDACSSSKVKLRHSEAKSKVSDQLDPTVGAFIIMLTLIVMLIWGKLCAVMCAAAWFYIIPCFRAKHGILNVDECEHDLKQIDVDSSEYKKKVVLEGLITREVMKNTM
ncbi:Uncharacterized protein SHERM_15247 [Striga hermonthica]|uniref:Uncharacterized protein n=1 Tax=Striga hermonthica TaxID=68872 RepID=A0A9N7R5Z4_STRHE|nr:Uncharacterized protein SHERM_15247 [Striga hermonthica]